VSRYLWGKCGDCMPTHLRYAAGKFAAITMMSPQFTDLPWAMTQTRSMHCNASLPAFTIEE
jgi:hypothetical protein